MNTVISQRARDMIEQLEIGSQAEYEAAECRLSWPGGASGVTGGIGYDFGYETAEQIATDWTDLLGSTVTGELCKLSGIKAEAAQSIAPSCALIVIPYAAAILVFEQRTLPRYIDMTTTAFPMTEGLSPDSLGALVSLVYNRGAAMVPATTRLEMAQIRDAMNVGNYNAVPGYIRAMKRLWEDAKGNPLPGLAGLLTRRDREAELFEEGLDYEAVDIFAPVSPIVGTKEEADAADAKVNDALRRLA